MLKWSNDLSRFAWQDLVLHFFCKSDANCKLLLCGGHNTLVFTLVSDFQQCLDSHKEALEWGNLAPELQAPFHNMMLQGLQGEHDDMLGLCYIMLLA